MAKKKATKKKAAKKKPAKKKAPTLNDLYNRIAAKADTQGVKINAADTRRVLSCFFDALEDYPPAVAFDLVAKGLMHSGGRRR